MRGKGSSSPQAASPQALTTHRSRHEKVSKCAISRGYGASTRRYERLQRYSHRRYRGSPRCDLRNDLRFRDTGSTTKVGVDLHAHVVRVLLLSKYDILRLEPLRSHAEMDIRGLPDAVIHVSVLIT